MQTQLTTKQVQFLRKLLPKHEQDRLIETINSKSLTQLQIDDISDLLSQEIHLIGLTETFELTAYGVELTDLVQFINTLSWNKA